MNGTSHEIDILVFGTMGNIGPQVQELLASHGLRTAAVPFMQNVFRDEPGYRRTLVRAIADYRPGIVFPIGNPLAMSRFKGLLELGIPLGTVLNCRKADALWKEAVENVRIAVEKEETVRLLDSKVRCHVLARELGIMRPAVYDTPEDVPVGMKVVFKRDVSFGGHGVHLPKDMGALERLIAHQSPGEPFLIEEFIPGADYSLDAVRWGGKMVSGGYKCLPTESSFGADGSYGAVCLPAKDIVSVDGHTRQSVKGLRPADGHVYHSAKSFGPVGYREVLHDGDPVLEKMKACARTILEHLDYQGVCGFDFRVDNSENVRLLECNPRFTGGVAAQAAAGFDIPWTLYSMLKEDTLKSVISGENNIPSTGISDEAEIMPPAKPVEQFSPRATGGQENTMKL